MNNKNQIDEKHIKSMIQANRIKVGDYVIIRGRPCKVISVSVSKTGKHGHTKVYIKAIDKETNEEMEDLLSSISEVEVASEE